MESDPNADTPVLEVRDLAVSAGGTRLLSGVSFSVAPGESVALRGPSGCGKTTLLRVLALLDAPAGGEVLFDGGAPGDEAAPAHRRRVTLVPQQPVLGRGTLFDVLARPFEFAGAPAPFDRTRAEVLLERVGIGDRGDQSAESLSVGQRQRAALVRGILVAERMLLLDEPTSALDEAAVADVESLLRESVAEQGLALIVVTHDRDQATRLCDRVIDMTEWALGRAPETAGA